MIVDSKILETYRNAYFGPSFPTPERGLHIRVDAHEDEDLTIDIGPRDEDGIRTVRITADPRRGSHSAARATQNGAPAASHQAQGKAIP